MRAGLGYGLMITGSSNFVQRSKIGTDQAGDFPLGNSLDGIFIDGSNGAANNTIGGLLGGFGNLISANEGNGIRILGNVGADNLVVGNKIGTDNTGNGNFGNFQNGIYPEESGGNIIGSPVAQVDNVISGNQEDGILIEGAQSSGTTVLDNIIGMNISGTSPIANGANGVEISNAAKNSIGGLATDDGNLISGNSLDGVLIHGVGDALSVDNATQQNLVVGNMIGTNATGNKPMPNQSNGVEINLATNNTIGGDVAGAGNLISGNINDGILITNGSASNLVQGNSIGTNLAGNTALPNAANDIELLSGATKNSIGGAVTATTTPGNVVSGNALSGISINGVGTTLNYVQSNDIGTTRNGIKPLGNTVDGLDITLGA